MGVGHSVFKLRGFPVIFGTFSQGQRAGKPRVSDGFPVPEPVTGPGLVDGRLGWMFLIDVGPVADCRSISGLGDGERRESVGLGDEESAKAEFYWPNQEVACATVPM